jgi:hypothetical protein
MQALSRSFVRRPDQWGAVPGAATRLPAAKEAAMNGTGDKCPTSGRWADRRGHEIIISAGDTFPPCPWEGTAVTWTYRGQ